MPPISTLITRNEARNIARAIRRSAAPMKSSVDSADRQHWEIASRARHRTPARFRRAKHLPSNRRTTDPPHADEEFDAAAQAAITRRRARAGCRGIRFAR
jgi:hypothetical protein